MRRLKKEILDLLGQEDQDQVVSVLLTFKARVIVNPLFSLIQETDEKIRENAARAMGQVVAKLAREQMEAARIVMRRLMWNLNDESGGIGWGSPEAMAEMEPSMDSVGLPTNARN